MKVLFGSQVTRQVIERGYKKPQDDVILMVSQRDFLKDMRKKDKKALFLIYKELDEDNFKKVAATAKDAREILQNSFKGVKKVIKIRHQSIRAEFKTLDYDEVFAPVIRMETIRLIISIAAQNNWSIYQMDVKSVFFNKFLGKKVYIKLPLCYITKGA